MEKINYELVIGTVGSDELIITEEMMADGIFNLEWPISGP